MNSQEIAEQLWNAINRITRTEHHEVEDPNSERPIRYHKDYLVKDEEEKCIATMVKILDMFLKNQPTPM